MRRTNIITTAIAFILLLSGISFGYAKNDQDCSKCHTLSNDQAKNILDDLVPNIKVLHVVQAQITGMWEVGADIGGKKAIIYLDYSKKYIISPATGGNIVELKTKANLTMDSFQKINKVDVSKIPLKDALVMGDRNAKHKVIVFDDPD